MSDAAMSEQWRYWTYSLCADPREFGAIEPVISDILFATAPIGECAFAHGLAVFELIGDGYVEVDDAPLTEWLPLDERRLRVIFADDDETAAEAVRRARIVWRAARARLS